MKNLYLLPTDKPSRLGYLTKKGKEVFNDLRLFEKPMPNILDSENQNIYITSDEEIKEVDWMYYKHFGEDIICKYDTLGGQNTNVNEHKDYYKKIILTTDQDLINNGVQAIDNEFLEWFVKNPSCEEVKVQKWSSLAECGYSYHIIIPKEEPKQESLEEVAARHFNKEDLVEGVNIQYVLQCAFIEGAKWQAERMYSEEDLREAFYAHNNSWIDYEEWFEQFKKK